MLSGNLCLTPLFSGNTKDDFGFGNKNFLLLAKFGKQHEYFMTIQMESTPFVCIRASYSYDIDDGQVET